ncbi:hypothetical protein [Flavobacterium sp.]|jgi:hypothetical protein|uniref:hypothetical protein n=1 Tax=Flavobacterium sp. TaxID=239 RepID=UPI0025E07C94|nr:hypothetical protein [Flavobacterium sp.]
MKRILIITFSFLSISIYSQNSKFSLKYNYGLNIALQSDLIGVCTDCKANTIGTVGNLELEYKISPSESIGFGVAMAKNKKNSTTIAGEIYPSVVEYILEKKSTFFELYYKKDLLNAKKLFVIGGIGLMDVYSQEKTGHSSDNHKLLSEPGITFGAEYYLIQKLNFEIGIHSKIYWTPFNDGIQNIGIAPVIKYNF